MVLTLLRNRLLPQRWSRLRVTAALRSMGQGASVTGLGSQRLTRAGPADHPPHRFHPRFNRAIPYAAAAAVDRTAAASRIPACAGMTAVPAASGRALRARERTMGYRHDLSTSSFRGARSASPESITTTGSMDSGSPCGRPGMTAVRGEAFSRRDERPSFASIPPSESEGAGKTGCRLAPAAPVRTRMHGAGTTGSARATRPSLRDGLRLIRDLLGAPGLLATVIDAMHGHQRQLDTSVGVSGPRDFTVRAGRTRQLQPTRPSHPTSRP